MSRNTTRISTMAVPSRCCCDGGKFIPAVPIDRKARRPEEACR